MRTVSCIVAARWDQFDGIHAEDDESAIAELREKIPDFRRAYDDDGLAPEEFADYAPLLRFRKNFIDGCDAVLDEIAKQRRALTSA